MSMQRYFIDLAYDGTAYHGWQIQPNADTVQERLKYAIETVCREKVEVVGAGRTDAGVHARSMYAHFDLSQAITDEAYFIHQLNGLLPIDIAVNQIYRTKPNAHARFDALQRRYVYKMHFRKDPFLVQRSYLLTQQLAFDKMNKASAELFNYSDFSSFSKLHTDTKTNNCQIAEAKWDWDDDKAVFSITADRFLRNMVRAVVGTLIQVGLEKIDTNEFKEIIESKNRSKAGFSAPAHGLYLYSIAYPESIYE